MKTKEKILKDNAKVAPHSLVAEQSVLGGLMLDNAAWDKVSEILKSEDFYMPSHQIIFQALEILAHQDKPFDVLILSEHLKNYELLDKMGGETYLFEIVHQTPSAANIQAYAKIVREKSILRKIVKTSTHMINESYQTHGKTADELLEEMEKQVLAINQTQRMQHSLPLPIQKTLPETILYIEKLKNSGQSISGLSTEFKDFDKLTSGLQPSDLIVIAGRPSMGKTTFAMNIAENSALKEPKEGQKQKYILVFSMEMPSHAINMRMISSVGRINHQNLRLGNIEDKDWEKIGFMMNKIQKCKTHCR